MHPAQLPIDQLKSDCTVERTRRSGPGGQHRNKVETAVVVTHDPTGVVAEASERRSQAQNLTEAYRRLRIKLAVEHRTQPRDQATDLWQGRSRGGRLTVSTQHDDYPALLAEALDVLAAESWDDRAAAERLSISRTQLVRFLQTEPAAMAQLNAARVQRGMTPLR